MPEPDLPFTREEYAARLAKTRAAMDAAGVELLFAADPSNMAWLTGYDGWSFYVPQGVLVPPAGEPVWWGRGQDEAGALRTVYMARDNVVAYPDHYVQTTERHPMEHLASVISERGFGRMRIGVEMDNYYYSAAAHAVLGRCLPDAEFVDATSTRQLGAGGQVTARARLHADGGPDRDPDARTHRGYRRARAAQERHRGRDPPGRDRGAAGRGRRLSGNHALASVRGGRLRRPPHLDRRAAPRGGGHLLRDRGLLPPLSLSPVPDGVPRGAAGPGPAGGRDPARSDGGGARAGPRRQHLQRCRERLLRHPREARHPQGQPRRLPDRDFLSARLGGSAPSASGEATGRSFAPA